MLRFSLPNILFSPFACERRWRIALLGAVSIAACSPATQAPNEAREVVRRDTFYGELARLEDSFGDLSSANYGSPTLDPRSWVRDRVTLSQSDFETARVRRLIALEELSGFYAPSETAPDFNAFWEIHSAYRLAVETSRPGTGAVDLVYTRPYLIDPFNGPQIRADNVFVELRRSEAGATRAEMDDLVHEISTLKLRLLSDADAGFIAPPAVLSGVIAQIQASPMSSQNRFSAWVARWQTARPDELAPTPEQISRLSAFGTSVVPALEELQGVLMELLGRADPDSDRDSISERIYPAIIAQVTADNATPDECHAEATRLTEETADELIRLAEANWSLPVIGDDGEPLPAPPGNVPNTPLDILTRWDLRAPVLPPAPMPVDVPEAGAPPVLPVEESEPVPPRFTAFLDAIDRKSAWLTAFSVDVPPDISFRLEGDTAPDNPVPTRIEDVFGFASEWDINNRQTIRVSLAGLNALPLSVSVVRTLEAIDPGHRMRLFRNDTREDRPQIARDLSVLSYDLGWMLYSVRALAKRGAFDDAPQLEAAMLYRRLEWMAEAETETGFLAESWTEQAAIDNLIYRLGISRSEASDRLLRMRAEPGFGCAALEGYNTLVLLRERAEGVLGNRFNVRDFHDVILSQGSRPLSLVERDVDDWIAAQVY